MDLVLLNGNILTVDKVHSTAQAAAVKDGKIVKIGTNKLVQELIYEKTEVVDLKGKTVLPGFIDAHTHPALGAVWADAMDFSYPKVKSISEILEKIEERVQKASPGEWIKGVSYDHNLLAEKRHPNRWELDEVAPNNPVVLCPYSSHESIYNSKALELAGISKDTPDPPGGRIERDPKTGEPTGLLCETASFMMREAMPLPGSDEFREYIKHNLEDMARWGITTVCDIEVNSGIFAAYQELLARDELPVRVTAYLASDEILGGNAVPHLLRLGIHRGFGNDWLAIVGVKFFIDGSLSGHTAALHEPYVGEPGNRGILYTLMRPDEMHKWVKAAHDGQLQVAIHAIGDRAIDAALDVLEVALKENPRPNHRHRIEHCALCTPKQLKRIKQLEVIPGSNMGFIGEGGDVWERALGEERMRWIMPARSYIDNGIISPSGSDYPAVWDYNPLLQIQSAVTRKTEPGKVVGPSQRISVIEAIEMLTIKAAYSIFEEDRRGSIEPGKLADLVVLSQDPLKVPFDEIENIEVLMTIVGGKRVYSKQTSL
jgi:predicted amidohydrolase YtcJ